MIWENTLFVGNQNNQEVTSTKQEQVNDGKCVIHIYVYE